MADVELEDRAEALQAEETAHAVPVGYWVLLAGLVLWGVYYLATYLGWNQAEELEGPATALGADVGQAVAYTAIPAAVVLWLAVSMARRRRGARR